MVIKRAHHLIWLGHNTGQEIISEQMPVNSDRRAGDGVRHRGFLFLFFFFFLARGQLRMLSSLGISSPLLLICILLPTPALISKSPCTPSTPPV